MTAPRLEFGEVFGGYGGGIVVHDVSAEVAAGEALCVVGRNGVGKSTLLKLLFGFLPLASGYVRFDGVDVTGLRPAERSRLGIGFCPQERVVFDDLSVLDNLTLMASSRRLDHLETCFARFPRLAERLSQTAGTLSGGERKILSFVRAFAENKPLVMLDEPTEGVQSENIGHMSELINQRKASGTAFVIVEQNLDFVAEVVDSYLVLDQGRTMLARRRDEVERAEIVEFLTV